MPLGRAPGAHTVRVRELSTGKEVDVAPVDARERVSHPKGGWEYVTEANASPAIAPDPAPVAPPPPADPRVLLETKSHAELKALGKSIGLDPKGMNRDAFIEALLPHIENGTINVAPVPGLPRDPSQLAQFPGAAAPEA